MADEPESVGGTNTGPTPYDYLLTALGTCTGMTLRMYADRKQWPLTSVTVQLTHRRIHATDCEQCETDEETVDEIGKVLTMEGDLDAEQ